MYLLSAELCRCYTFSKSNMASYVEVVAQLFQDGLKGWMSAQLVSSLDRRKTDAKAENGKSNLDITWTPPSSSFEDQASIDVISAIRNGYRCRCQSLRAMTALIHFSKAVGQLCSTASMTHNLAQCQILVKKAVAAGAKVRANPKPLRR